MVVIGESTERTGNVWDSKSMQNKSNDFLGTKTSHMEYCFKTISPRQDKSRCLKQCDERFRLIRFKIL